ncbi:MAG: hypothetical protein FJW30_25250 [Acidobacteria bacterium]|nr:hypothetical protein [Acidobacteriota bacterium]
MTRQSALFASFQHSFRLATEPGTRRGMKGPFLNGYFDSVGNMHGWGDGDPFLVNYVGHPMQGSVSGYIYLQNNPKERVLRFGSDRRYWRSRMKAMGAAWAYSTMFELGPFSEASIGKVQARRPQQGFVDHVVTPLIGVGWMITEDFLDEKVVLPFERRMHSTWARMMVRGWLNPSRSFANLMRMKVPWYRDSRGGILSENYRDPFVASPEAPRQFPTAAPFELTAIPVWTRFATTQCGGGGGQAAFRVDPHWQIVGQLSGCQLRDMAANRSGDALSYMIGPRWTPLAARRVSPFAQVLVGGKKITRYEVDLRKKALLTTQSKREGKPLPEEELYTQGEIRHGLGLAAGAGVDVRLNPVLALRLGTVEYTRSWIAPLDGLSYNRGLQLSSGIILRMGTW